MECTYGSLSLDESGIPKGCLVNLVVNFQRWSDLKQILKGRDMATVLRLKEKPGQMFGSKVITVLRLFQRRPYETSGSTPKELIASVAELAAWRWFRKPHSRIRTATK